jgi:transposase-like protein
MPQTIRPAIDLLTITDAYDTDAECRAYLEDLRWPTGPICPRCGGKVISRLSARKQYECDDCEYQFSVTAGTVFHDSHLPLPKWFVAIFLICESRKGMSANQLKRMLKVSYKTAWYLCHRIRHAMAELNATPLTGCVEVDETYVGRGRGMGSGNRERHTMVLAAVQRGGAVRINKARGKSRTREELHGYIRSHVADECDAIYTDEAPPYKGIADANTRHETVNHSKDEWVRGDVHTNTVESVFSLFKRSIVGSFHQVSAKHLDLYLDEFEFRFNNRKNPFLFRDTLLKLIEANALPYEKLTA